MKYVGTDFQPVPAALSPCVLTAALLWLCAAYKGRFELFGSVLQPLRLTR